MCKNKLLSVRYLNWFIYTACTVSDIIRKELWVTVDVQVQACACCTLPDEHEELLFTVQQCNSEPHARVHGE